MSHVAELPRPVPCLFCDQPYVGAICPICKEERPTYTALKRMTAKSHHGVAPLRDPQFCRYFTKALCDCGGRGLCIGEAA